MIINGVNFDRGVHYDWYENVKNYDPLMKGNSWLNDSIRAEEKKLKNNNYNHLVFPKGPSGEDYSLKSLNIDQAKIAFLVLKKLLDWKDYCVGNKNEFEPLRLTVCGKAGTGKKFLIHTLVTEIRKLTQYNDSIIITAPTGKLF